MFDFFHRSPKVGLFWTTDIHSHVCPGIDDGAPDPESGCKLVEKMAETGFTSMVVTPHVVADIYPNTTDTIDQSLEQLKKEMDENGVEMKLIPSAEYRIDDLFYEMLKNNALRPLPDGKHILVENAWLEESYGIQALGYKLIKDYDWIPVLAHPERYLYYHDAPERYSALIDAGFLFQVNLLSLSGYYGKKIKKVSEDLLSEDKVSFVGSDVHRLRHVDAISDYLRSSDFKKLVRKAELIKNDTIL